LRRLPGLGNIAVGDDGFVREPHPAHTGRCGESTRPRCSPRYQRFESAFLQRGVCKPSVPASTRAAERPPAPPRSVSRTRPHRLPTSTT
jgi:hypothetical protein